MPVQGTLSVHSRTLSKPLWSITTQGFLLCHSLNISPCLPMLRFEDLPVAGFACQKVHLQLLDKETGEIIFEIHSPTFGMGASGCLYEPLNRRWSLLLAGERIQLHSREAPPP